PTPRTGGIRVSGAVLSLLHFLHSAFEADDAGRTWTEVCHLLAALSAKFQCREGASHCSDRLMMRPPSRARVQSTKHTHRALWAQGMVFPIRPPALPVPLDW